MTRYLIVAHQTASTPELRDRVASLIADAPDAEFAILVPALPQENFSWEGENVDVAEQRADSARAELSELVGAHVVRSSVGPSDPLHAIENELEAHGGYDAIVISTLHIGVSRWLRTDLIHQAARKFDLPVIHVETQETGSAVHR
jgi:nucleotide-binding universal stress UspA family protein